MRAALPDHARTILEAMEAGSLTGADPAGIQSHLDKAANIEFFKKTIRYFFAADGFQGDLEGHPVIYVIVERKSNRIVQCGTVIPEW